MLYVCDIPTSYPSQLAIDHQSHDIDVHSSLCVFQNPLISNRQSALGMFFTVSIHDMHDMQTTVVLDHPPSVSQSDGIPCNLPASRYYSTVLMGGLGL